MPRKSSSWTCGADCAVALANVGDRAASEVNGGELSSLSWRRRRMERPRRMAMIISRNIATPPRTRVITMLVLVRDAFDSSRGTSEDEAGTGVTETVTVGPAVEKVIEEMLDAVVVKVLDSVIKEVVLAEGRGLGPGGVLLKGGGNPPPPGKPPPTVVVMAEKDIHTQSLSDPTSSLSSLPAET